MCIFARFFVTMKKIYINPISEVIPFYAVNTLCGSGDGDGPGTIGGGDDPGAHGRAPRHVTPF